MPERIGTVVIGGGQAGLSVSRELTQAGVEHAVLERGRVAETWRGRWDSFCLVTPNWSVQLPGHPYDGDDPDGFMPRDELVAYLPWDGKEAWQISPFQGRKDPERMTADDAWRIDLAPTDNRIQKRLRGITVTGFRSDPHCFVIRDTQDGASVMLLGAAAKPVPPTATLADLLASCSAE